MASVTISAMAAENCYRIVCRCPDVFPHQVDASYQMSALFIHVTAESCLVSNCSSTYPTSSVTNISTQMSPVFWSEIIPLLLSHSWRLNPKQRLYQISSPSHPVHM
jgi:hypothetical protein